jgi:hypothetical protein
MPGYGGANCTACPIGTFSLGGPRSSIQCTPCSTVGTGFTTAANTSTSAAACAVCLPGFGGENCTVCAKGTWSAGGVEGDLKPACTACADVPGAGYTTAGTGSNASTACNICIAGYGGVVYGTCSQCPIGTSRSGEAPATVNCTTCTGNFDTLTPGQTTCNGKHAHFCAHTACQPMLVNHFLPTCMMLDMACRRLAAQAWGAAGSVGRVLSGFKRSVPVELTYRLSKVTTHAGWQQYAAAEG